MNSRDRLFKRSQFEIQRKRILKKEAKKFKTIKDFAKEFKQHIEENNNYTHLEKLMEDIINFYRLRKQTVLKLKKIEDEADTEVESDSE